jgi:hypothetical protein
MLDATMDNLMLSLSAMTRSQRQRRGPALQLAGHHRWTDCARCGAHRCRVLFPVLRLAAIPRRGRDLRPATDGTLARARAWLVRAV